MLHLTELIGTFCQNFSLFFVARSPHSVAQLARWVLDRLVTFNRDPLAVADKFPDRVKTCVLCDIAESVFSLRTVDLFA